MARRRRLLPLAGPLGIEPERELHLLCRAFVGPALMLRSRPVDDSERVAAQAVASAVSNMDATGEGLPAGERVERLRAALAERGLLDQAERHVAASWRPSGGPA